MPIATPTLTATAYTNYIEVAFANSDTPTYNYLKRNGVYISKTVGNDGMFSDYATKSGEQVFYEGIAYDGTQESAPSAPKTATVTLTSAWIHYVYKIGSYNASTDVGKILEIANPAGETQIRSRESNTVVLAAAEKPRIKTSPLVGRYIECPIYILQQDLGDAILVLEEMIWSNDLFCFRSNAGDLMFCTFADQEIKFGAFMTTATLRLVESAYSEAI